MSSKSTFKGFLLSSTPVQSPEEDSGYFGSNQRKSSYGSNAKVWNNYSPIKELHFKNLSESFPQEYDFDENSVQPKSDNKILDYKNFARDVYESSGVKINEFSGLEFASDSVIGESKICQSSEQKFPYAFSFSEDTKSENCTFNSFSKNEDIKYNLFEYMPSDVMHKNFKSLNNELSLINTDMKHELQSLTVFKQTKIDFIHHLKQINCLSLVSSILSYLSAKELCAASCVDKEWNQVIQNDHHANLRRKNFVKERDLLFNGPCKENRLGVRSGPSRQFKKPFSNLTNINTTEHPLIVKDSNTRFDSFIKESKNGHSKLLKCPKCCYASKCLNGTNYTCTHCSYTFCSNCLNPVFKKHACSKPQLPNIIVGSKKSKKNLRRL